jgi:peptidoglycan/xylan/chitin deacetylase (PgdA/CDA1 family)
MARHIACLTFDFDVVSAWVFRGGTTPTQISRGEFGLVGAERILSLLKRYSIPSTWFIPGHTIDTFPDACRRVVEAGHEVGHHGYLHEPPALLTREQEDGVLARGNESIRRLTGSRARGYRSPAWDLSPHTVELLLQHGISYDSSMMGHDDQPYWARQEDVIGKDGSIQWGQASRLIEMPISWSLDDFPHFEYRRLESAIQPGLMHASGVLENFVGDFRFMVGSTDWGALTYTFHPQVVGRGHRMLMLEQLIRSLSELGATFMRMGDVAGEWATRVKSM